MKTGGSQFQIILVNANFVYQCSEICKSLIELLRFSFSNKYSIDYFRSHDSTSLSCFEDTRPLKSFDALM